MKTIFSLFFCLLLTACATSGEVEQINFNTTKRLNELESRLNNQKLMELFQAVERHEQQLTLMRGDIETMQHDLSETKKHQKDLYSDLDNRISEQNIAQKNNVSAKDMSEKFNLTASYKHAMELINSRQFNLALPILTQIIASHDQPNYIADAGFWIGITYTGLNEFNKAIEAYKNFLHHFPSHPKAPEALFNIASCYQTLNQEDKKEATLKELIKRYPNSNAAKQYKR
ncbi:MAG: tetratricopeptide repeat protein [Neisseriales bacterium]|nr:MAG: tetratricopeptide repeat protein [Neisseriales bacterium]